jgi:UDP-N-acetylmuramate--alanine ligase
MNNSSKIHCIGIGGIGLSGIAQLYHERGNKVSGSDIEHSYIIEKMKDKGIKIEIGHDESNLEDDVDMVVFSSAILKNNVELEKAKRLNVPVFTFSEAIKEFTKDSYTIAVAGTHGKTTVTAFTSLAMIAGEKDPTVIIGSLLKEFGNNNYRLGKGDTFIVEACEYKRNFLNYTPDVIILTNIEAEHLDYFKDLDDYRNAFREFISKLPENGFIIANADDENVIDVIKDCKCNKILFSAKDRKCDWYLNKNEIWKAGKKAGEFNLSVPGEFNKLNALCGLILGQIYHIDRDAILDKFSGYNGAWRRFEQTGRFLNMQLVSDYAHHPTAIKKTLNAAKEKFLDAKICCVFQPHQYNRTKEFLPEFANSFKDADIVIIPDIYQVRDKQKDVEGISPGNLIDSLKKHGKEAYRIEKYEEIKHFLSENRNRIDVVFIMGAGDIWNLSDYLLSS